MTIVLTLIALFSFLLGPLIGYAVGAAKSQKPARDLARERLRTIEARDREIDALRAEVHDTRKAKNNVVVDRNRLMIHVKRLEKRLAEARAKRDRHAQRAQFWHATHIEYATRANAQLNEALTENGELRRKLRGYVMADVRDKLAAENHAIETAQPSGTLEALCYAIGQVMRDNGPMGIAYDVIPQRVPEIPEGTVRVLVQEHGS